MSPIVVNRPEPGVVELRLNRPDQRNAVNTPLLRQLRDEIVALGDDRRVKVVVLSGEGSTFCAGADLNEFAGAVPPGPGDSLARVRFVIHSIRGLLELEPITIAAVHGAAVGAGWGLALGCHICWAVEDTTFVLPEVAKGFRIPRVIVQRLAAVVGPVRAAELVLSGQRIDVDTAMSFGAVTRRFPDVESMRTEALAFASSIARQPRTVLRGAIDPLRALAVHGVAPEIEYQWTEKET